MSHDNIVVKRSEKVRAAGTVGVRSCINATPVDIATPWIASGKWTCLTMALDL